MGLVLDTWILIADERGRFDMPGFLRHMSSGEPCISSITASELLHGVERAIDPVRRHRRQRHVEQILASTRIEVFDLTQARHHASIWADLETRGEMIGPHDLVIASAALALDFQLAMLNSREFQRVKGLRVMDAAPFLKS